MLDPDLEADNPALVEERAVVSAMYGVSFAPSFDFTSSLSAC